MKNEHRSDDTEYRIDEEKGAGSLERGGGGGLEGGTEQESLFEVTWFQVIHEKCSL
jgi:hypothetical protein